MTPQERAKKFLEEHEEGARSLEADGYPFFKEIRELAEGKA